MPTLRVALTGGIGSGKTQASNRFAALGVPVLDADEIAHALTAPGQPALQSIRECFGPKYFLADGTLDRKRLRQRVFQDPKARQALEDLLHPQIRAAMLQQLDRVQYPYAVLVIPLLFETRQTDLADRILVVDVPESVQIERVQRRSGLSPAEIRRILAAQVPRSVRLAGAQDRIDNRGSLAALISQVDALHARYLALSQP